MVTLQLNIKKQLNTVKLVMQKRMNSCMELQSHAPFFPEDFMHRIATHSRELLAYFQCISYICAVRPLLFAVQHRNVV